MRIDTKVIQVSNVPSLIQTRNEMEAVWGWSVLSIQITDQKTVKEGDSYQRESFFGDKLITETEVITEHVNYATITYQRDLDDPISKQLADLEAEYHKTDRADVTSFLNTSDASLFEDSRQKLNKKMRDWKIGKFALIFTFVSFLLGLFRIEFASYTFLIFGLGTIVFFLKAWFSPSYFSAKKYYKKFSRFASEKKQETKNEIREHAELLRQL